MKPFIYSKQQTDALVLVTNFKMPTIVGILKFVTSTNFMLMRVDYDFFFYKLKALAFSSDSETFLLSYTKYGMGSVVAQW